MGPLSQQFVAYLPAPKRTELTADADLEARLDQMVRAARAAWPDVELDTSAFLRYAAERVPNLSAAVEHGSDLYLACACAKGNRRALAGFEMHFLSQIEIHVRHIDSSSVFQDELKQLLRSKLFVSQQDEEPKIRRYTGRGPLAAWLRVVAIRTAQDMVRANERNRSLDEDPDELRSEGDPEGEYLKARYRPEFRAALEKTLAALTSRDRNILRLYYFEGLSSIAIARMYRVSGAAVRSRIQRCRSAILTETRRLLSERLGVDGGEFESLMGLVQSQVDVSISRILKESSSECGDT